MLVCGRSSLLPGRNPQCPPVPDSKIRGKRAGGYSETPAASARAVKQEELRKFLEISHLLILLGERGAESGPSEWENGELSHSSAVRRVGDSPSPAPRHLAPGPATSGRMEGRIENGEISHSPAVRRWSLAKSDKQGTAEHPVFCEGRPAPRRQDGAKNGGKNGEVSHSPAVRRWSLARSDKQGTAEHPVFCEGRPEPQCQDGAKEREEIKTFEPERLRAGASGCIPSPNFGGGPGMLADVCRVIGGARRPRSAAIHLRIKLTVDVETSHILLHGFSIPSPRSMGIASLRSIQAGEKMAGQYSKNPVSVEYWVERLGVDGEFDENNEEDLSSLRVQQKFRLLSAILLHDEK
ncbi:hypothetical protein B0H13DRAFT_2282052 [Mycena leptocephala]|nr:hypothetical protein B0H13DRAFT_2282052 [Mycena leptocephala]